MKANHHQVKKLSKGKKLFRVFSTRMLNKIGKESGFYRRKRRKITPEYFLNGFFIMACKGMNTFSQWANEVGKLCGSGVSKQAVWKRMTGDAVCFLRRLLETKIAEQIKEVKPKGEGIFSRFKNVFLHDTTNLHLPDALVCDFPGNNNHKQKQKAIAKIEAIYNFTSGLFTFFGLRSFTENDQRLSGNILSFLKRGDLIIRDLGFFVLDVFNEVEEKGAYFLTRKHFTVNIYDLDTGKLIDLIKTLKKRGFLDKEVGVGEKKKMKARLIAVRLPEYVAAERIRKSKKDRDRRTNHSQDYYTLLHYVIFLTNVPQELWTGDQVVDAYRLRWRIEIIFKSWKSVFNIQKLIHRQCSTKIRVECVIYLMLLFIMIFQVRWYEYFRLRTYKKYNKHISLLKFARLITVLIEQIITRYATITQLQNQILKHALYESRKDRINTMDFFYSLAA